MVLQCSTLPLILKMWSPNSQVLSRLPCLHRTTNTCFVVPPCAVASTWISRSAENSRRGNNDAARQTDGETERERWRQRKEHLCWYQSEVQGFQRLVFLTQTFFQTPLIHFPSYTHTHTHFSTLLKSHYISLAFGKLSPVPLGYSQTRAPVTPPRSRVQLHSAGLSLLRQIPLSSKMLHNPPQRT